MYKKLLNWFLISCLCAWQLFIFLGVKEDCFTQTVTILALGGFSGAIFTVVTKMWKRIAIKLALGLVFVTMVLAATNLYIIITST